MAKTWNEHATPYVKAAMRKAMEQARKTWKGKKKLTPAKEKRVKTLQQRREQVNKEIRAIKEGRK